MKRAACSPIVLRVAHFAVLLACGASAAAAEPAIRVLFLGDNGPHRPAERFAQLAPAMAARGIEMTYTDRVDDLNSQTLAAYDGLAIYANITRIERGQEQALLDYVASGKALVALHCASFCFHNSPAYIDLVGAQFQRHGVGAFRTTISAPDHPIMRGFGGFESWDETYIHHRHNDRMRTVLEVREEAGEREPWTWVRTHGQGRVFYTAWGHDARTWCHRGFHNLVERGIRWAAKRDVSIAPPFAERTPLVAPAMTPKRTDVEPFEYEQAKIAYYPPGGDRKGDGAWNQMQKPLAAAESIKHFVTPVGFHVELFADEPMIAGKPISMAWDERGRAWLLESIDYPNELQPEGQGRDRIRILEDSDGDGRADRSTVFAEGLSIPTSLVFSHGGVIVHQAPQTLFLKDTDGDDRADLRHVLLDGWLTHDTHAGPSNLRYGLDNWLWSTVGYSGFDGTVGREALQFRQGVLRFRPDASKLEFVRSTNNNTWGLGFSEEGIVFASTANRNPSVYVPVANRYYERVRGWSASVLGGIAETHLFTPITERVRQVDHHIGYTAGAGHALYTARTYPADYWNRTALVTDPTGHLAGAFSIWPVGADFRSKYLFNLLASDDEWSAPVFADVGPDGHVWVIDWYNYIVQHNPTPVGFVTGKGSAYETLLRDKTRGRIYRVVYDDARPAEPTSLAGATPQQLVETLAHPNMLWRLHAQRLLVERGRLDDVEAALVRLAEDRSVDAIGLNVGAIHALWTLDGLGAFDGSGDAFAAAVRAVRHESAGVRRNAALVLPASGESAGAILEAGLLIDGDAQVRLAALLALAEMPASDAAGRAVAGLLLRAENAGDTWLADAMIAAAAQNDLGFLAATAEIVVSRPAAGALSAAPLAASPLSIVRTVAEHFARAAPVDSAAALVCSLEAADPLFAGAIVDGLARGWPKDQPPAIGDELEASFTKLVDKLPVSARGQLASLAARWGSTSLDAYTAELASSLWSTASDERQADAARIAAARQVVELSPADTRAAARLLEIITPRTPLDVATGFLEALSKSESRDTAGVVIAELSRLSPTARAAALRLLLARAEWTQALLGAIERGQAQLADLSLDQRQALLAHPFRPIGARARKLLESGGGLPSADRQKVVDDLMRLTQTAGDALAGKIVFKDQCAKCHVHGGEGSKIGPDLTGMAVHPKAELLVHILDPSRSVEGNYRAYTLATADGRILSGLLTSETRTSLELIDAEAKSHVVLRDDIDQMQASAKSLMPDGFEKQLSPTQLADLLEYLTARGRYLPLPLDKAATVVTTKGMFSPENTGPDRLVLDDWGPRTVEGVPFVLIDPRGATTANAVMLHSPRGALSQSMPHAVRVPCHAAAKAVHLLSGVAGWGYPATREASVSMIVRLHYEDGAIEDHALENGVHFADYIRRVDVPQSKHAFMLRGQQMRYLSITPKRDDTIADIELVKGSDETAPIVMAMTAELR